MSRDKDPRSTPQSLHSGNLEKPKTPLDLWKLMAGSKAKRVSGAKGPPSDSLLAVFKDRFTFTFILGREVASIHFDKQKQEIFFKGHNIRNLKLETGQIQALNGLMEVLKQDKRGELFLGDYDATLRKSLAENK